jgi:uncharacterized protein (DUF433 family)
MPLIEPISHITRDELGVAWVDDTNVKVIELVLDHLAYGWGAEALHEQFPHLTLAQIHATLACFYDHQEEFERLIRQQEAEVARWQNELGESPLQRRLRQLKLSRLELISKASTPDECRGQIVHLPL